jgi:Na+/H+-translocating membrane pyrophosphatase
MILGGALANAAGMEPDIKAGFILFPMLVHTLDLTVSTIAIFFVKTKPGMPGRTAGYGEAEDALDVMKRGYYVSLILALVGLFYICKNFLNPPQAPQAYFYFFGCSGVGVVVSFLFVAIT